MNVKVNRIVVFQICSNDDAVVAVPKTDDFFSEWRVGIGMNL